MTRIFLTLSMVGTMFVLISFLLGLNIEDARQIASQPAVSRHILLGLGGLCFAALVHAIVFTYFMGTGRWIEETSRVYSLSSEFFDENQKLKYGLLPLITGVIVLLVLTGAFGGAADPGSRVGFKGWAGLSGAAIHMTVAISAGLLNVLANLREFWSIERNGQIIENVMSEVRRIRTERGLSV